MTDDGLIFQRPYLRGREAAPPMRDPYLGAGSDNLDELIADLGRALRGLGNTSSAVARRLAAMRCKGERGNPRACPVLDYLKRQRVGRFGLLMLSGGWLEVTAADGWCEPVRVPAAVQLFQELFDLGRFPECASPTSGPGAGLPFPDVDWEAEYAREDALKGRAQAAAA